MAFYAEIGGWWWALALIALYVAALFGVLQLLLWPLAIFELDRPLTESPATRSSGPAAAGRGGRLALVLLAINVVGLTAALVRS